MLYAGVLLAPLSEYVTIAGGDQILATGRQRRGDWPCDTRPPGQPTYGLQARILFKQEKPRASCAEENAESVDGSAVTHHESNLIMGRRYHRA